MLLAATLVAGCQDGTSGSPGPGRQEVLREAYASPGGYEPEAIDSGRFLVMTTWSETESRFLGLTRGRDAAWIPGNTFGQGMALRHVFAAEFDGRLYAAANLGPLAASMGLVDRRVEVQAFDGAAWTPIATPASWPPFAQVAGMAGRPAAVLILLSSPTGLHLSAFDGGTWTTTPVPESQGGWTTNAALAADEAGVLVAGVAVDGTLRAWQGEPGALTSATLASGMRHGDVLEVAAGANNASRVVFWFWLSVGPPADRSSVVAIDAGAGWEMTALDAEWGNPRISSGADEHWAILIPDKPTPPHALFVTDRVTKCEAPDLGDDGDLAVLAGDQAQFMRHEIWDKRFEVAVHPAADLITCPG